MKIPATPEALKVSPTVTITFVSVVDWLVRTNPAFNDNADGIRASVRILAAIEGKNEGDDFSWRPGDAELISAAARKPTTGYHAPLSINRDDGTSSPLPVPGALFVPYLDVICPEAPEP